MCAYLSVDRGDFPLVRVITLGEFAVERLVQSPTAGTPHYEAIPWEECYRRKAPLQVLKFLLCAPGRRASRDELMHVLWPSRELEDVQHAFETVVSILRRHVLGMSRRTRDDRLLITMRDEADVSLKLSGQQQLWIDADEVLKIATQVARCECQGEDPLPLLEQAWELVQGTFLEDDPHASWSVGRRLEINGTIRRILYKMITCYLNDERQDEAEALLFTFLSMYPTDQDALYHLLPLLAQRQRWQEAYEIYHYTVNELHAVGKEPAPYIRALAQRLKAGPGSVVREGSGGYMAIVTDAYMPVWVA